MSRGRDQKSGGSTSAQGGENESSAGSDLRQMAMAKRARDRKIPQGGGEALDGANRARMEGQLGGDLSDVRIHTGSESAEAADDLQAHAFTVGKDVHFGAGQFQPGTRQGDKLLAHELAHAQGGTQAPIARYAKEGAESMPESEGVSAPGDADEKKADEQAGAAEEGLHGAEGGAGPSPTKKGQPDAAGEVVKGATGIITGTGVMVKDKDGKDQELKEGTVVEVESAKPDELAVKVHSGIGAEAVIPKKNFKPEPGVALDDHGKPRDDVYADFGGAGSKLWDGEPKPEDVKQGYIADCYFMAGMMSVAAANNKAIMDAFTPPENGKESYNVRLFKKNDKGDLEQVSMTVDTNLPALKEGADGGAGADPKLAYGGLNKTKSQAALWPSLMEKAYAQLVGGYQKEGAGGFAGDALEAITGQKAQNEGLPAKENVITRFTELKKQGKAVICGTLGSKETKKEKAFKEKDGTYSATLTTHQGEPCEVMKNTLKIEDEGLFGSTSSDDGNGAIVGDVVDKGTIDYPSGKAEMKFKADDAPDSPDDLTAEYSFRGLLDNKLNVHAWHMYVFEDVSGDNLIFKNPWGVEHPEPIPADKFLELFTGITSEQVPKEDEPPPGAK
jgi:hypothetical protein